MRRIVLFGLWFSLAGCLAGCATLKEWALSPVAPAVIEAATNPGAQNLEVVGSVVRSVLEGALSPTGLTILGGGAAGSVLYPAVVRPVRKRREAAKGAKPT